MIEKHTVEYHIVNILRGLSSLVRYDLVFLCGGTAVIDEICDRVAVIASN